MNDVFGSAGGQLARVIASRGGRAEPEAALVIEHREALIYMLCEAAELEHAIMCEYLFAAFSLKQSTDEGLTEQELAAVTGWRRSISLVASQEMLHLALVHNLLSAVGAAPHLGRPNMPQPARHYPAGVQLALVPFGEQALRHFMFLERPEGMQLEDAEAFGAASERAVPLMGETDIVPRLQDFATVGHLYRSIELGIAHLADKYGERWLFVGPPKAQASKDNFRWPELVPVTDLASAQRAIDTILEQGEGARGNWQDAHFGQFVNILDEYQQMLSANPAFEPARPVAVANVRPCEHDDSLPLISDPVTARCTDLFNVGYEVLLQSLERYFAHTEETDAQLATLADTTLALMLRVLKPLGDLITTLPVGPDHPGMTAGPSFELFYESDYLMPHRGAAWALLEERLREATEFCVRLQGTEGVGDGLAARLAPVGQAFSDIADSLAAHFPDWGASSRYAKPDLSLDEIDTRQLDSLLQHAAELASAVSAAAIPDRPGGRVGELFAQAHQVLFSAAEDAQASPSGPEVPEMLRVGSRLVNSVLRPLADALLEPLGGATSSGQDATSPRDSDSDSDSHSDASIDDGLWALALAATQQRASLVADDRRAAPLAEATAALQDLTLQLAPADGSNGAEARRTRLRELQTDLPLAIEIATDGPYLITNAANLCNGLGERLQTQPQMALCRCGRSGIKPFCHGSHARVGFSGEKDPKRVPDYRETYIGQQLTVLDNRGICQHSGFCTDRLPSVFHTEGDAFVTPSGGRMDEIIRAVRDCPSGALSYAIDGIEAREDVDYHDQREPAIEVSTDGPYRITGTIPLTNAHGELQPRTQGATGEHYALCRCGHSQNKPFCSGMHWYIEFKDPIPDPERTPTMFEWCGGMPALTRMTRLFYEKHVSQDPMLAPLFANMSADHPQRVAKWLGEVFGGPPRYSEEFGGYPRMVSQHVGKCLKEEWRARWVALLLQSAREVGMPDDSEFATAFQSYIEWGSRLAVENSQTAAHPPEHMPMPHWDWSTGAGPPGGRISALAPPSDQGELPVVLPADDEPVRFEKHIKPLFRQRDRQSMRFAFDLWAYEDVAGNAAAILERVRDGTMPCDGIWPPERVETFERWTATGMTK